jgi:hypothetical protein
MESDCEDLDTGSIPASGSVDITKLFEQAQLSIHPWQELYDHHTNDLIASTTNTSLNGKLYAKLLVCLEGQALQDIVSRPQLCANGILLLQELVQSYRPKNVPEIIAAKTGEFWS